MPAAAVTERNRWSRPVGSGSGTSRVGSLSRPCARTSVRPPSDQSHPPVAVPAAGPVAGATASATAQVKARTPRTAPFISGA